MQHCYNFKILIIACTVLSVSLSAQSRTLTGKVSDKNGEALSFVSIYIEGTTNATFTNVEGRYEMEVPNDQFTLVFQFFGYKSIKKVISRSARTFNAVMEVENFDLPEVVIYGNAEDPAYGIMRDLIANKENIKKAVNQYETDLYIKGVLKLLKAPKKIMGSDVGDMSGILDSNRQGIIYLSESQSKLYFQTPDSYKEVMQKSIVSGSDDMISMNQFSTARVDFYNEAIQFVRDLVSPLADNAFSYYKFRLENTYINEDGNKIDIIKVIPKSEFRPCFFGELYVNESKNCIHSLVLNFTGDAIKQPIFDTIRIRQVHVNVGEVNQQALLTQTLDFKAGALGFKMSGNFMYVFSNYILGAGKQSEVINENKAEIYAVSKDAIQNDTLFWNSKRPVPLSEEERFDYIRKDSLKRIWKSEAYLDSVDAVGNKFKFMNIFFGYSHNNSFAKKYWGLKPLFSSVLFNAVEGFNFSAKPFYTFYSLDESKRFNVDGELKYGFSDQKLKANITMNYRYDRMHLSSISFNIGKTYNQYDSRGVISPFLNMFESLFYKDHFAKVYVNQHVSLQWQHEVTNGLLLRISTGHSKRKHLENSTDYSFFHRLKEYDSNIPSNVDATSLDNNKSQFTLRLRWVPGQQYMTYPEYRNRLPSPYPTFSLNVEKAVPFGDNASDFTKLKISLENDRIPAGVFGHSSITAEYGRFLSNKKSTFIDYFHFVGSEIGVYFESDFDNTFLLQPYYNLSSTKPYVTISYQHHFEGWMTDKLPLLNKWGVKTVLSLKTIQRQGDHYYETGFGLEGIKLGIVSLGRLDYVASFNQSGYIDSHLRFGIAALLEQVVD